MIRVILDTNFLVYCAKQKIDLLAELDRVFNMKYEIILPSPVISELRSIFEKAEKKSDKDASLLALALVERFLKQKNLILKQHSENADNAILNYDSKEDIIATLDVALRKKLKNAKILTIKQRKYFYLI